MCQARRLGQPVTAVSVQMECTTGIDERHLGVLTSSPYLDQREVTNTGGCKFTSHTERAASISRVMEFQSLERSLVEYFLRYVFALGVTYRVSHKKLRKLRE